MVSEWYVGGTSDVGSEVGEQSDYVNEMVLNM